MSSYSGKGATGSDVTEPAGSLNPKIRKGQKKENESARGERLAEKCDQQPDCQARMGNLDNIQLSNICSLSQFTKEYDSHVSSMFGKSRQVPVSESCTSSNEYKLLSELHLEGISLDADTISISSNESGWDIMEVGEQISDHINTKNGESKGKNQNRPLREKGGPPNEPKLPTSEVSCPRSKLENSGIGGKTTANAESVQIHSVEAALSPFNKAREVFNVAQTLSTSRGLENRAGESLTKSKLDRVPMVRTRSTACTEKKGITRVQEKSSSSVREHENMGNEQPNRVFCCARDWLAFIYGNQLPCSCAYSAGFSTIVSQPAIEAGSCKDEDHPIKDLSHISANTVQMETTSFLQLKAQDQLRLPFKKRCRSNDNFEERIQETQTYVSKESSGVGKGELQVKLSEEENSHLESSLLNSVFELKNSETCGKTRELLLDNREKAPPSENELYNGKDLARSILVVSAIASNNFDSDLMEAEIMIPEKVPEELSKPFTSGDKTLISLVSKLQHGKSRCDENLGKEDQDKNILNIDRYELNPLTNGEMPPDHIPRIVEDITQGHKDSTSVECDRKKNPMQSEPNKLVTTSRRIGQESSNKICHFIFRVRDVAHDDCQVTTSIEEEVENTQIREENMQRCEDKNNKSDGTLINKSEENRCVYGNNISAACEEVVSEVREEPSSTSGIEESSAQLPPSLDNRNARHSQNLSQGDQGPPLIWTDQLSEIIAEFPSGMHNTSHSEDIDIAVIDLEDCREEVIGLCLDSSVDLVKQFDEEYKILLCKKRKDFENQNEKPSDNVTKDTTEENKSNKSGSKEFCCYLSWSASVCGEQSKCQCTSVPQTTNSGEDEKKVCSDISHQSCKDKSPLIKDPSTANKGKRSSDQTSRPQLKPMQKNCNSKEYISGDPSRNEKAGSPSSATVDSIEGPVKRNSGLPCVSHIATANKKNKSVNKKMDSVTYPEKETFTQIKQVCEDLQARSSTTGRKIDKSNGQIKSVNENTPVGKQDCGDRSSRKKSQNKLNQWSEEHEQNLTDKSKPNAQECSSLDKITQPWQQTKVKLSEKALKVNKTSLDRLNMLHLDLSQLIPGKKDQKCSPKGAMICTTIAEKNPDLQSKICSPGSQFVAGIKTSKNIIDEEVDFYDRESNVNQDTSYHSQQEGKKGSKESLNLSRQRKKLSGKKTQHTQTNTGRKRGRSQKDSPEHLQVYYKRADQSPLKHMSKNLFLKKKKTQRNTITSTLTRDSGIDLQSKTKFQGQDSSSLLESNMDGSSLTKQDLEKHPKNQKHNLHTVVTRSKKQKKGSSVPRQRSPVLPSPKLNCSLGLNNSEQNISPEKTIENKLSPKKDSIVCNKNKCSEKNTQNILNLEFHIQEVIENRATMNCQNAQLPTEKSVTCFNNKEMFPRLETKAGSRFRKLDEQQTPSKDMNALVNKLNTSSVRLNTKDLNFLPVVQKVTYREIVPRDKPTDKSEEHITVGIKARSKRDERKMRSEQDKLKKDNLKSPITKSKRHVALPIETPCTLPKKSPSRGEKRRSNNPGSESGSSKRRKSELSNHKNLTAENIVGGLHTHIGNITMSSKSDASVVEVKKASGSSQDLKPIDQPPNKIQKLSYLENTSKNNLQNQQMEANSPKLCVPKGKIEAVTSPQPTLPKSTNKGGVEEDTKSMNSLPLQWEKVASPTPDKSDSCWGRSIDQQTKVRECVLKLHRLPLSLERQFLSDNTRVTGKVIGKIGAEQSEKS